MDSIINNEQEYKIAVDRLMGLMTDISLDKVWDTEFTTLMREINKFKKQKVFQDVEVKLSTQN